MWATWVDIALRQDVGYMGQPRAKTGANLRPNRANIGQQQQPQQQQPQQQQHPLGADGSAFAGARLSGVSLINPGAGPAPRVLAGGLRW